MPRDWIENPESVTADVITTENNQERKRALCEILGWERALDLLGAKVAQRDDYGALLVAKGLNNDGSLAKFCKVTCPSTARCYILRVPPDVVTCREGLAWAAGVEESAYEFAVET